MVVDEAVMLYKAWVAVVVDEAVMLYKAWVAWLLMKQSCYIRHG